MRDINQEATMYHTLGTLLETGVPILTTIDLTRKQHPGFAPGLSHVYDSIHEGRSMFEPMRERPESFTPGIVPTLVMAGEETGCVDIILKDTADFISRHRRGIERNDRKLHEITFYKSLDHLLKKGLPLQYSFEVLKRGDLHYPSPEAIGDVGNSLRQGNSLSESMQRSKITSEVTYEILRAREVEGVLVIDSTPETLANYLERQYELTSE